MTDKPADSLSGPLTLTQAVIAWRDVRERIFRSDGLPPPALWTELGHAELALMAIARNLEPNKAKYAVFRSKETGELYGLTLDKDEEIPHDDSRRHF